MFGMGFGELLLLGLIIFLLIGPNEIPRILQLFAKFLREIKKAQREWKRTVDEDANLRSIRDSMTEVKNSISGHISDAKTELEKKMKKVETEAKAATEADSELSKSSSDSKGKSTGAD